MKNPATNKFSTTEESIHTKQKIIEKPKTNNKEIIKQIQRLKKFNKIMKNNKKIKVYKVRYQKNSSSGSNNSGMTIYYDECISCGEVFYDDVKLCIYQDT